MHTVKLTDKTVTLATVLASANTPVRLRITNAGPSAVELAVPGNGRVILEGDETQVVAFGTARLDAHVRQRRRQGAQAVLIVEPL